MSNDVGVSVSERHVSFQTINCTAFQTFAFRYPNLGTCLFSYFESIYLYWLRDWPTKDQFLTEVKSAFSLTVVAWYW
jgi:hypothetical protein